MRASVAARLVTALILIVSCPYGFSAQAEASLEGNVKQVIPQRGVGDGNGTHMVVSTKTGLVEVCLGPSRFLEANQAMPQVGDIVKVKGHPVTSPSGQLFLASSFASGGRTFTLRNNAGKPRWSGCGHDCGRAGNCEQHHAGDHHHHGHQ